MSDIKRINRELVANGSIIDYYRDTMQFPNGNIEKWDTIVHRGAAAMMAVLEDGRILLVRQYRNALERETIEIPAGGLNLIDGKVEPTRLAAIRELEEETGYVAEPEKVEMLASIYTTVAFCNEKIDIYLARDLKKRVSQHLDENEYVNVEAYTLDELKQKIYNCEIQDSKTACAIMIYANKYGNKM